MWPQDYAARAAQGRRILRLSQPVYCPWLFFRTLLAARPQPWHPARFGFDRLGDTQSLGDLFKTRFVCVESNLTFQMFQSDFLPGRSYLMVLPNKSIGQRIKLWGACPL